jgi:hypothetical protein
MAARSCIRAGSVTIRLWLRSLFLSCPGSGLMRLCVGIPGGDYDQGAVAAVLPLAAFPGQPGRAEPSAQHLIQRAAQVELDFLIPVGVSGDVDSEHGADLAAGQSG